MSKLFVTFDLTLNLNTTDINSDFVCKDIFTLGEKCYNFNIKLLWLKHIEFPINKNVTFDVFTLIIW